MTSVDSDLFILRAAPLSVPASHLTSMATAAQSVVFPDASGNVVLDSAAQTMAGKTLTSPAIDMVLNISNANAPITFSPTSGGDDFVTTFAAQEMLNKGFNTRSCYLYADTGADRRIAFDSAPAANFTTTTLRVTQRANRMVTFPDASGFVCLIAAPQTLAGKTIDSAANTLTVTNASLGAANINTLLNQPLLTTSSPTHAALTLTSGLVLPAHGGVPTPLTFHSDGVFDLTFTGPVNKTISCNYVRVGRAVTFSMNGSGIEASTGGFFTASGLPTALAPVIMVEAPIMVADVGMWEENPGLILVSGTTITIYRNNKMAQFTAGDNMSGAGFGTWSWSWVAL